MGTEGVKERVADMVSSTHVVGHAQVDGRRYVVELHTDVVGVVRRAEWLSPGNLSDAELTEICTARAAALDTELADREAFEKVNGVAAVTLSYQTAAQFATRLREWYRNASREELCRLAWWLVEMLGAGLLTDAQLRSASAFDMTANAWNSFKAAKLVTAHDHWAGLQAAQGE